MSNNELTDKERILTLEVKFNQHLNRVDSYHYDAQKKMDKIFEKLDNIPSEDKIFRMFAEEGRKLAKGLTKDIDEVKGTAKKAEGLAVDANNEIKFAKRQGYIFAGFVGAVFAFIGWFVMAKDKIVNLFSSIGKWVNNA